MLRAAADRRGVAMSALVAELDAQRIQSDTPPGLAGAIRLWLVWDGQNQEGAHAPL